MIKRYLTPSDVECNHFKSCNKVCYENCTTCAMNTIAVKKFKEEKKKKDYYVKIQ
jgi:hypothetical protein